MLERISQILAIGAAKETVTNNVDEPPPQKISTTPKNRRSSATAATKKPREGEPAVVSRAASTGRPSGRPLATPCRVDCRQLLQQAAKANAPKDAKSATVSSADVRKSAQKVADVRKSAQQQSQLVSSADVRKSAQKVADVRKSAQQQSQLQSAAKDGADTVLSQKPSVVESSQKRKREDVWDYVWCRVETPEKMPNSSARDAEQAVQDPAKKRRLVGKQPSPELAIVLYRPRMRGKQAPPAIQHNVYGKKGHYDVLGVRRDATPAEIHAAYRRRALATHPDKGAKDAREFHLVVAAFEELADEAKRAAYDRSLALFGRRDGMSATDNKNNSPSKDTVTQNPVVAARKAYLRLMASPSQSWSGSLSRMPLLTLYALQEQLHGAKVAGAAQEEADAFDAGGHVHLPNGSNCISKHKQGYRVTVTWLSLCVRTGFTKSLTQAIDWQIALLWVQGVAQSRMRRHRQQQNSPQAKLLRGAAIKDNDIDPLIHEELLQIAEAEAGVELAFMATVQLSGKQSKKLTSPAVADLPMALSFRQRFLRLAAQTGGSKLDAAIREDMQWAEKQAKKSNQQRKSAEKKLLAAVEKELLERNKSKPRQTQPSLASGSPDTSTRMDASGKRRREWAQAARDCGERAKTPCMKRPAAVIVDAPRRKESRRRVSATLPALTAA